MSLNPNKNFKLFSLIFKITFYVQLFKYFIVKNNNFYNLKRYIYFLWYISQIGNPVCDRREKTNSINSLLVK